MILALAENQHMKVAKTEINNTVVGPIDLFGDVEGEPHWDPAVWKLFAEAGLVLEDCTHRCDPERTRSLENLEVEWRRLFAARIHLKPKMVKREDLVGRVDADDDVVNVFTEDDNTSHLCCRG